MIFTGKNLLIIRQALEDSKSELHNMIATCPDVVTYADDLDEYEVEMARVKKLCDRIDKSLAKKEQS
jgi:hypothetical protein